MFVVRCLLFVVRCCGLLYVFSFCVVHCSLFVFVFWGFVFVGCGLLVVGCWLLGISCLSLFFFGGGEFDCCVLFVAR